MKVAVIHPPACDPTAPYLALPALAGFLRARGTDVVLVDANVEAFDSVLSAEGMSATRDRLEDRLARLDRKRSLSHQEGLAYAALSRARAEARLVPAGIDDAKAVLRDPQRFYDAASYARAVRIIQAGLQAVSAAWYPTFVDFMSYRTPFGLTSSEELVASASAEQFPFESYVRTQLIPRLAGERADVVGLSVCFPGQIHPAYILALRLKQALPGVHLTVGGPGITQILARLTGQRLAEALGPFDSAVLFEGERALPGLLDALAAGRSVAGLPNVVSRNEGVLDVELSRCGPVDLKTLPAPDFDGLPLARYFAPEVVLPYDPTRGCYWGRCAFCHYGLAERGTAKYRERSVPVMAEHLAALSARYGVRHVYLSHDSIAPKTLVSLAQALADRGTPVRWATDLKPEPYVNADRSETLRRGGAVACALGVESASNRVLRLIDKGQPIETVATVMRHLARAGIAVEAMCFTDFPTETSEEALQTLRFLRRESDSVAGFIVGEFGITHGSRVSHEPSAFGIRELWTLRGDLLGLALMFAPRRPWKSDAQRESIDAELERLSASWSLRPYPWAGAVSTAHTILYYSRFGPRVFRDRAGDPKEPPGADDPGFDAPASFDLRQAWRAEEREQGIWATLVYETREVSREAYEQLVSRAPALERREGIYRFRAGEDPHRVRAQGAHRGGAGRARRR